MTELVEMTTDYFGAYETRWECGPPDDGVPFWVLYQTWNDDYTVRTIHRVTLVEPPSSASLLARVHSETPHDSA